MKRITTSQQQKILNIVESQAYQIYRLRLSLGKCSLQDINIYLDLLIKSWNKIGRNPRNVFRKYSKGLIKAFGIDSNNNVYEPYIELFFLDLSGEDFALIEKSMFCNWITITHKRIEPFSIVKISFDMFKSLLFTLTAVPENFDLYNQNIRFYGCLVNSIKQTDYER